MHAEGKNINAEPVQDGAPRWHLYFGAVQRVASGDKAAYKQAKRAGRAMSIDQKELKRAQVEKEAKTAEIMSTLPDFDLDENVPSLMKERAYNMLNGGEVFIEGMEVGEATIVSIGNFAEGARAAAETIVRFSKAFRQAFMFGDQRDRERDMGDAVVVDEETRFTGKHPLLAAPYGENPDKENQKD
jgi:hypothetical protein